MAQLLSVNVGLPNDIAWRGQTVHTAVWKRAVSGPRMVRRVNLDGDGQGDLISHGHRREELERALRIAALSAGWKNSFPALLQQEPSAGAASTYLDGQLGIDDRLEVSAPRGSGGKIGVLFGEPIACSVSQNLQRGGCSGSPSVS